ncbi:MAG TPA: hypothetical protein VF310_00935 [Vicinamibacteria bacterium]
MSNPARPALLGSLAFLLIAGGFVLGRASVPYWPLGGASPRPVPATTLVPITTTLAAASPTPAPTLPPVLAAMEAAQPPPRPAAAAPAPAASAPSVPQHPPLADPAPVAVEAPRRRPTRPAVSPPPASAPPAPAVTVPPPPPPPPPRRFVLGQTVTENLKGAKGSLPGFDTSGVGMRRAPEVAGRLDVEMTPEEVRPGESYAVRIFLANEGRKSIQLNGLNVAVVADGKRTARTLSPRTREIAPRERVLLTELPGVWREGLGSWAVEVSAVSTRQDSYRNELRLQ